MSPQCGFPGLIGKVRGEKQEWDFCSQMLARKPEQTFLLFSFSFKEQQIYQNHKESGSYKVLHIFFGFESEVTEYHTKLFKPRQN